MYQARLPKLTLSAAIRLRQGQESARVHHPPPRPEFEPHAGPSDRDPSDSSVDIPPVRSETSSSSEPDTFRSESSVRSESSSLSEPQAGTSGTQPPVLRKQPSPSNLVRRTRGKMPAKKNEDGSYVIPEVSTDESSDEA